MSRSSSGSPRYVILALVVALVWLSTVTYGSTRPRERILPEAARVDPGDDSGETWLEESFERSPESWGRVFRLRSQPLQTCAENSRGESPPPHPSGCSPHRPRAHSCTHPACHGRSSVGGGESPGTQKASMSPLELLGRTLDEGGMAMAVASHGDTAYVGTTGSLAVYDVSDPLAPSLVNEIDESVSSLERNGTTLGGIVGCGTEFALFDLTDPLAPVETGRLAPPDGFFYTDLALGNDVAIVIGSGYLDSFNWCGILQVVDVSDPSAPTLKGTVLGVLDWYGAVHLEGNTVYLAAGNDGLVLLDISGLPYIGLLGVVPEVYSGVRGLDYDNGYVYLAGNGLEVIDVSDPLNPALVGQAGGIYTSDVEVSGNYAFEANDDDLTLWIFDITDPTAPFIDGALHGQGKVAHLDLEGDRAYLPDSVFGLLVVDIDTPTAPQLLSTTPTGARPFGVDVEGTRGVVTTNFAGVRTLDVSDPENPTVLGTWVQQPTSAANDTYHQIGIDLSGDLVVSGDWAMDGSPMMIHTYDVHDPAAPELEGSLGFTEKWYPPVRQVGSLVYTGGSDLQIIDISDPQNPFLAAQGPSFASYITSIAVVGERGYVSSAFGEIAILDLSNPLVPVELNRLTFDNSYLPGIAVDGDTLGVFWEIGWGGSLEEYSGGLMLYDVSDPAQPQQVGEVAKPETLHYSHPGGANVAAGDGRFFLAAQEQLLVFDVRDLSAPILAGAYPPSPCHSDAGMAGYSGVQVANGLVYLAGHDGLEILRYLDVGVVLTPESEPLAVSRGESFSYEVQLKNYTSEVQIVFAWTDPMFVSGVAQPLPHPVGILAPGESLTRTLTMKVPFQAPPGEYDLVFHVGAAGARELDSDGFTFEVLP